MASRRVSNPREGQSQSDAYQAPIYHGLEDYAGLKARSDDHYAAVTNAITNEPGMDPFRTMKLAANSMNSVSPMAPWFQALQDRGATRLSGGASEPGSTQIRGTSVGANADSEADRVVQQRRPGAHAGPTTIGDNPSWWAQPTGPFAPTPDSLPPSLRPYFPKGQS